MSNDEKLLKALAVAIVDRPRATLKDLAEAAGVSKATLHRFCGTRDSLVERLMNHSQAALNQVIEDADLQVADVAQALRNLIENHLRHRELLVFMIFQYRPDSLDPDKDGARWIAYTDALDSFFLRGQQEGYFRIDITAELLAGNALCWRYHLNLPVDDSTYVVYFDDWMYLMDDDTLINRSLMSKFGIELGQVTLFFRRGAATP